MQAAQAEQQTALPGPMPARLPAVVWKTATQPAEAVQAMASNPEGPRATTCIHHSVCNTCTGPSPCVQKQCPLQMVTQSNPSAGSAINPGDNAPRDPRVPLEPPPSPFGTPEPQVTVPSGAWVEHTVRWPPGVHVVLSGMYADVVDYIESTDHGKVMTLPDEPGVLPQLVESVVMCKSVWTRYGASWGRQSPPTVTWCENIMLPCWRPWQSIKRVLTAFGRP